MLKKNIVIVILLLGLVIRLYRINLPLLDRKPHREIHTAEITRNLYWDSFNPTLTKTKLWADEPGYYLVEFPIYNILTVIPYYLFDNVYEMWGKLISVLASLGLAVSFYLLVKLLFNKNIALWSLVFFYLLSPQEIILSRSFQPDQLGLFFAVTGLYYFTKWIKIKDLKYFILSYLFITLTLLTKIQFFPVIFPMFYLAYKKCRFKIFSNRYFYIFITVLIPIIIWFSHVKSVYINHPQLSGSYDIYLSTWFNPANIINISRYINFLYDFSTQVTTVPVLIFAFLGFFLRKRRNFNFLFAWLIGLVTYVLIFNINISIWYYQVPLIFPVVIFAALFWDIVTAKIKKFILFPNFIITTMVLFMMFLTGRPYLLRTYQIDQNHENVLDTANIIRKYASFNSKIITTSYNSAVLTYYSLRKDLWGGTLVINNSGCKDDCLINTFEDFRKWGAKLYAISDKNELSSNPSFDKYLRKNYSVLIETDQSIIFKI